MWSFIFLNKITVLNIFVMPASCTIAHSSHCPQAKQTSPRVLWWEQTYLHVPECLCVCDYCNSNNQQEANPSAVRPAVKF